MNLLDVTFKRKLHNKENKDHLKILAMGIYGLLLFSLVKEMTDFKVMNVFKSMVTLKINLAAIVLAKTLSLLNHCKKARKGT